LIYREPSNFASKLLDWYDRHHRDLPWRITPAQQRAGMRPDPYRVWLSEIMLQQTTVQAVKPYFEAFLAKWPDVASLAAAETDDVMKAWAGLGYYSRARNLKKCAEAVVDKHGGAFPSTEAELRACPASGRTRPRQLPRSPLARPRPWSTAMSSGWSARYAAIATPLPEAKPAIRNFVAEGSIRRVRAILRKAMMDLGATICTPRRPACVLCPLRDSCAAMKAGDPERFPVKAPKAEKPRRRGARLCRNQARRGSAAAQAPGKGTCWAA
jgi:A/G-specific adenine glycosylase